VVREQLGGLLAKCRLIACHRLDMSNQRHADLGELGLVIKLRGFVRGGMRKTKTR
jgi:hypothetical protein